MRVTKPFFITVSVIICLVVEFFLPAHSLLIPDSLEEVAKPLKQFSAPTAQATAQYTPTGGQLVVGTETTIVANATSGNVGSWKGTLAQDATSPGYNWTVNSSATTGLDQQVYMDGVLLSNANKFEITIRASSALATLNRLYQICDWVSTTSVDNAADAQCTGGGWRTLNIKKANITATAITNYTWHIYDGYWTTSTTGNTTVSTPLSNFISANSNKRVLFRAFSSSLVGTTHTLDWVQMNVIIDPIYMAAGFTQITGGSVATSYINTTNATLTGQSGSDNVYLSVPGTASAISDSYLSYKNVRTYTGMNTVVVVSEQSCSTTGINMTPKIYNFNSSAWENLTTAIACSTTDTVRQFAKNNITIGNYISSGEIRVGWFGSANNTLSNQIDYQYIMVGTTNTDTSLCEISFGTGTATACSNTRDLDSTSTTPVSWQITSELESATFGHTFYGLDNDGDAVTGEAAQAANLSFSITLPSTASITRFAYAMRWRSNTTTITTQLQLRDYSGNNATISGGWTPIGTTNANTTYTYEDAITNGYMSSNADDYIDTVNNRANVRLRTSVPTALANVTGDIDFAFLSIRWTEQSPAHPTQRYENTPTGGQLVVGTESTIVANATSGNVGSWKGTLAQDATSPGYNWTVNTNSSTGLNQQVSLDGVQLNGGNKMEIIMRANAASASLNRLYQICDWVSTTSVDNAADSQCTGGGWRTLNIRKVNITGTTITNYTWHIYDGYWTTATTSNTSIVTPLSNFITTDTNKRVLLRAFSTTALATTHTLDWVEVIPVVSPIYFAAGFTQITGGSVATSYINTTNATLTGQSGSDNVYLSVPGTASAISDSYLSYKNIKTYTGMNTIVVVSEQSCSTTGINMTPKIYNFTTTSWENLTTAIACSTTDTVRQFAKNNITITDYISSGEIRIGWFGSANNTLSNQIDYQYIILGSTNTNTGLCEISFGTGTATNCSNTRGLDSTLASPSTWQTTSELESATFGHTYYGLDNDGDAVTGEAAMSSNLSFSMTLPTNASIARLIYAMRWRSNTTTITSQGLFKDYSGGNATVAGGWTAFGTTNAATTYTYEDSITNAVFSSNVDDYLDTANNLVNIKVRTTASTALANVAGDIDFAFVSMRWVETASSGTLTTDIVDGSGASVSSPGVTLANAPVSFACQSSTGTLGTASQKMRVTNSTSNPAWTLSIAASSTTATWSQATTTPTLFYDFNDPGGCSDGADADTLGGQMTITPTSGTIAPQSGCSNTGVSLGSASAFSETGTVVSSITLMNASGSAGTNCYWELSGVGISQQIPGEQTIESYTIPLTVTIVAN